MTGFNLSDLTHHIPPPLVFTYFTFGPVRSIRREVRPSCWGYSKHHRYHYTEERSSSCSSNDLGPSWGLLQTIHFSNDSNDSSPQVMQGCSCRVCGGTETKNRFICNCRIFHVTGFTVRPGTAEKASSVFGLSTAIMSSDYHLIFFWYFAQFGLSVKYQNYRNCVALNG